MECAKKRLALIVDGIENECLMGGYGETSHAVTGEPFLTIAGGNIYNPQDKKADRAATELKDTADEAVTVFRDAMAEHLKNVGGKLYWRRMPEIVRDNNTGNYVVTARFLISDKRPVSWREM